jgi:thiol:disulfide interchange protein
MKKFNLAIMVTFLVMCIAYSVSAQPTTPKKEESLEWHTNIMKANEISKATNKPIFAFFTGSDWCVWCKRLQAHVFAKPEFVQWAKKNVVLLELDFPRGKQLSPDLTQQNASLQQTFGVQGYPTIWMFYMKPDTSGTKYNLEPLGSLGYPQGAEQGKEEIKFLKDANAILENKTVK